MRNMCKIHLCETQYIKMAQRRLDIQLRNNFQGIEFRNLYELITKVTEYEDLLEEETQ